MITGYERMQAFIEDDSPVPMHIAAAKEFYSQPCDGYELVPEKVNHVVDFFEGRLRHVEGEWSGDHVTLEPWQCWALGNVFGWIRKADGLRRFQRSFFFIPRKQGKTLIGGGVGLYTMLEDNEPGAKVYCAASHAKQARLAMNYAWMQTRYDDFVERYPVAKFGSDRSDPSLYEFDAVTYRNGKATGVGNETGRVFKSLAQDNQGSLDGLNPHCAVIDELHAHEDRQTWNAIRQGMATRRNRLIFMISTSGEDPSGLCREQYNYAQDVVFGRIEDERFFGMCWEMDDENEWDDPEAYYRWCPNLGVSTDIDFIIDGINEARNSPVAKAAWMQKQCNSWVSSTASWLNMDLWDENAKPLAWANLVMHPCHIAVDQSGNSDLTSICYLFDNDGDLYAKWRHYAPQERIAENPEYRAWHDQGFLEAAPGKTISQAIVREQLLDDLKQLNVQAVYFDPWQSNATMERLEPLIDVVKVTQNAATFGPAMLDCKGHLAQTTLTVDKDPLARWSLTNVQASDPDRPYPQKRAKDPKNKIDPAVTLFMALMSHAATHPTFTDADYALLVVNY